MHRSRTVRIGDDEYVVEGPSEWNRYIFEPGFLGETARWMVKQQQRELDARWERTKWNPFGPVLPPRVSELRQLQRRPTTPLETALSWAATAWVLWTAWRSR